MPGLAHQGGIGGEALDQGVGGLVQHAFEVGAVRENLDAQPIGRHVSHMSITP